MDVPALREGPRNVCGKGMSCVSPRCVLGLYSWLKVLRRGFYFACSCVRRVMDLVIGLSGRVGSLGRLRLTIQPSLFVCEKTQIIRRAKRVTG